MLRKACKFNILHVILYGIIIKRHIECCVPASYSYYISGYFHSYIILYHIISRYIISYQIIYFVPASSPAPPPQAAPPAPKSHALSPPNILQIFGIWYVHYSANIWNLICSILLSIEYKRKPPILTHCHHQQLYKYRIICCKTKKCHLKTT